MADPELTDDVRSTADSVRLAAAELAEIEARKSRIDPTDPEARDLAVRAEELGEQIRTDTHVERILIEEAQEGDGPAWPEARYPTVPRGNGDPGELAGRPLRTPPRDPARAFQSPGRLRRV